jgi:hypothetical protein
MIDAGSREELGDRLRVGRGEEDSFLSDQSAARKLAPLVPAAARAAHQLDEVGSVVHVAEDACAARRLSAAGFGGFEAARVDPGAGESVGRRQADDPSPDDGDLGSTLHAWR